MIIINKHDKYYFFHRFYILLRFKKKPFLVIYSGIFKKELPGAIDELILAIFTRPPFFFLFQNELRVKLHFF